MAADGSVYVQTLGCGVERITWLTTDKPGVAAELERRLRLVSSGKHKTLRYSNQDPNGGSTYYTTKGLFVEPSDGAVFAVPGLYGVTDRFPGGLGSAPNYFACSQTLLEPKQRARYLNLPQNDRFGGSDLVFCALTAKRQIAVVQFRLADMTCCGKDNYKFYVALFPLQKFQGLRSRKAVVSPRLTQ